MFYSYIIFAYLNTYINFVFCVDEPNAVIHIDQIVTAYSSGCGIIVDVSIAYGVIGAAYGQPFIVVKKAYPYLSVGLLLS